MDLLVCFLNLILGRIRLDAQDIVELRFCDHDCCCMCVLAECRASLFSSLGCTLSRHLRQPLREINYKTKVGR